MIVDILYKNFWPPVQTIPFYILFTMAELNQAVIAAKRQQDSVAPSLLNILVLWAFIIALAIFL